MNENKFGIKYTTTENFFYLHPSDKYSIAIPRRFAKFGLVESWLDSIDEIVLNKIHTASKRVKFSYGADNLGKGIKVSWSIRVDQKYVRHEILLSLKSIAHEVAVLEMLCKNPQYFELLLGKFDSEYMAWDGKKVPSIRESNMWQSRLGQMELIDKTKVKKRMTNADLSYIVASGDFDYMFDYIAFNKDDEAQLRWMLNNRNDIL